MNQGTQIGAKALEFERETSFAVVEREVLDDVEEFIPRLIITHVPGHMDKSEIMATVNAAGRFYGKGDRRWVNHSVLRLSELVLTSREQDTIHDIDSITFEDLVAEGRGEKRVVLRLPKLLYTDLTRRAESTGISFNDICIGALSQDLILEPPRSLPKFDKVKQRDAMRALYQIHKGARRACIADWIRLSHAGAVVIVKQTQKNTPESYAPFLWNDGENKGWLTDAIDADIISFVRSHLTD